MFDMGRASSTLPASISPIPHGGVSPGLQTGHDVSVTSTTMLGEVSSSGAVVPVDRAGAVAEPLTTDRWRWFLHSYSRTHPAPPLV
jgi:hypothetical protein